MRASFSRLFEIRRDISLVGVVERKGGHMRKWGRLSDDSCPFRLWLGGLFEFFLHDILRQQQQHTLRCCIPFPRVLRLSNHSLTPFQALSAIDGRWWPFNADNWPALSSACNVIASMHSEHWYNTLEELSVKQRYESILSKTNLCLVLTQYWLQLE